MRAPGRIAAPITALVLSAGCAATLPHPLTGSVRYLCCNLHYDRPTISDANIQQGTLIPLGSPVRVRAVGRRRVVFETPGHPPITLVFRYGGRALDFDTYLERILLAADPRGQLARLPRRVRAAIAAGRVEPGMTREHVLLAIGYPPAHRTPALDAPVWRYWRDARRQFVVRFDGDRVASVDP